MENAAHLFEAFLKCPTKCWLRASGEPASGNTYAEWMQNQSESFRDAVTDRLQAATPQGECTRSPLEEDLKTAKWRLAVDVPVQTSQFLQSRSSARRESRPASTSSTTDSDNGSPIGFATEIRLHAVERVPPEGRGKFAQFIPIRYRVAELHKSKGSYRGRNPGILEGDRKPIGASGLLLWLSSSRETHSS
jgi:hypothetical protein